jgi:hypothetical protein
VGSDLPSWGHGSGHGFSPYRDRSSGGGWITSGLPGQLASVVSYGYSSLKNVLFGPHMETEASDLYNAADAASH